MTFPQRGIIAVTFTMTALLLCQQAGASNFDVKVNRGRLSVTADKAHFGSLMDKIAKDAGFEVSISPDIASKTLSTDFRDLDMEKGVQRLMGLIRHRNFFMFYGRDGNIKKIEIYGASKGSSRLKARPPSRPGVPGQRIAPMVMDPPAGSGTGAVSRKGNKKLNSTPFIPPVTIPEYIPPRRGIGRSK